MRKLLIPLILAACTAADRTAELGQANTFTTHWGTDGTLSAGNNNDWWGAGTWCSYTLGACRLVGNASGSTLTGLDSSKTGCDVALQFYNAGSYDITVAHDSSSSLGANQIALKTGADEVLHPGYTMFLAVPCVSGLAGAVVRARRI